MDGHGGYPQSAHNFDKDTRLFEKDGDAYAAQLMETVGPIDATKTVTICDGGVTLHPLTVAPLALLEIEHFATDLMTVIRLSYDPATNWFDGCAGNMVTGELLAAVGAQHHTVVTNLGKAYVVRRAVDVLVTIIYFAVRRLGITASVMKVKARQGREEVLGRMEVAMTVLVSRRGRATARSSSGTA